ncbi:MAG: hypothetical protein GY862_35175 [Gammaproteobacteria bacterium]|nr:hypothetical protein [Gammaproteobacteria bacterium]
MILHTEVDEKGILAINKLPKPLWGKKVTVSIDPVTTPVHQQWDKLLEILEEADALDFPRRSQEQILKELRIFRESQ